MAFREVVDVLLTLLLLQAPSEPGLGPPANPRGTLAFLEEPDYFIETEGDKWRLRKPKLQNILKPAENGSPKSWVIFEDEDRTTVEQRRSALPRLRLNCPLVKFNPLTQQRTPVADWTGQQDALEIETDIHTLLYRFASTRTQTLISSTPVYLARLSGASGHTAEQWNDRQRFVIYLDPFRATGRLHAASTLVHELSHIETYRTRGFHANRAAAVLPKADFILLGAVDELASYQAEAALVRRFLKRVSSDAVRRAVGKAMQSARLRWPAALILLLGFDGPSDTAARMREVRKQIVLDLHRQAVRYWESHQNRRDPTLEAMIRNWYSRSREWKKIAGQRKDWLDAVDASEKDLVGR